MDGRTKEVYTFRIDARRIEVCTFNINGRGGLMINNLLRLSL
jgi:hypothetical protein